MNASGQIRCSGYVPILRHKGLVLLVVEIALLLAVLAPPSHAQTNPPVSVVNVLVLYTPQARDGAGGTAAILKQIDLAVLEANTVFQNSYAATRVHLALAARINYRESGSVSNDLARLRNPQDPIFRQAHTLRNQFAADLVCLVTETGSDWWFYGLQGPSADNAFSILRRPYLVGAWYLPVALSFNFGCQLERPYADSVGAFPYAYGYSFWANDNLHSTVDAFSGQRLPFFSNPGILFQGVPAGVPAGRVNSANNALVISQTAPIVAAFRGTAPRTLPPSVRITAPADSASFRAGFNVTLAASAADPNGKITRVDYYAGTNWLSSSGTSPFKALWRQVPPGEYSIIGLATDNQGATTVSDPIHITVRPVNDDFTNRTRIIGRHTTVRTSNWLATSEPGEPNHAGSPAAHSLWWTYTAPATGVVTLDASGSSFAPSLSVYTGTVVTVLAPIASSSDNAESTARFQVSAGQTCQIALDSPDGETGDVVLALSFAPTPANDNFAHRQGLAGTRLSLAADNHGATREAGEPDDSGTLGCASLWWSWTAPAAGELTITLTNSVGADLLLGVYTGDALTNLAPVATSFEYPSSFVMPVQPGVTYALAVDSPDDPLQPAPFIIGLDFAPEPTNDAFAHRTPIRGSWIMLTSSSALATTEPDNPAHNGGWMPTLWWSWTAPVSGYVTVGCPSGQFVDVFAGTTLTNLVLVASGTPANFEATRGTTYALAASGLPGDLTLNLALSTVRLSSPADGTQFTVGSNIPLTATATKNDGSLRQIEFFANGASVGTASRAPFTLVWHNVQVGDYALTAVGTDLFGHARSSPPVSVTVRYPRPANDNFAERTVLHGTWILLTNSDWEATSEPGEPNIAGTSWGNSIWWAWTAPVSGRVTLSTTAFLTALGVYTGDSISNLTEVAGAYSATSFAATAGTTYNIAAVGSGGDVVLQLALSNLRIVSPADGAELIAGTDVPIEASVTATEQPVRQVEFFHDAVSLGIITSPPYSLTWSNVPAGGSSLTVVATDTSGHPRTSPPVAIEVRQPNDNFTNAITLFGERVHTNGSTANATIEAGEPRQVGMSDHGSTVWYCWTAPSSAPYSILAHAELNWAFMLEVFTGSALTNLTLACGNYTYGAATFSAQAGTTDYIALDNVIGDGFTLDIAPVPANDAFADAVVLTGTNVTVGGVNSRATSEPGEPNHTGGAPGGHSVWYTWTAPARGAVTIGATGTDFTPVVASYTGTNISNLARLGTNSANGVSFVATAGAVYDIAVDGSGGYFTLNLSLTLPPGNDDFGSRSVLSGMSPGVEGSAFLATFEPGEPGFYPWVVDRSVWYSWIAPADGAVRVHCPLRPIAVYSGSCVPNLTVVASVTASNFPDLTFTAIAGTEYEVAVAGAWWLPDDFTLSLQEAKVQIVSPTNGAVFSPPVDIDIVAQTIDLEGAVRTVAFFDGTNLLANVTNAPFRMTYARPSVGSHRLSAQATDENGLVTTSGANEVRVKPPNDDFAQRTAISGDSITFSAANDGATSEPGESLPAGATGRTLWWSWTAPSNGTVTISATAFTNGGSLAAASPHAQSELKQPPPAGTNASQGHAPKSVIIVEPPGPPGPPGPMQGPLIAVYTGSSVASLGLCASNTVCYYSGTIIIGQDPSCQSCVLPTVQFPVAAGKTYQISVDGVNGSMGRAIIGLSFAPPAPPPTPPANDRFSQRLVLTGCSLYISGTTVNATREPGEPSHRTDAAARTVWYSWTAPVSGTIQLETMETSEYALAPALALGVYAGASLWNLIPVTTGFSSVAFYALAGTTYQIAIAGPSGLETGFDLTLNAPPPPPSLDPTNTVRLRNGTYRVRVTGVLGQSFIVQASSNSRDWAAIRTDTLFGPYLEFIDTTASRYGQRFYRVLPLDAAFDQRPFRIMASRPDTHAGFPLRLAGMSGQPFRLQASTNLLDWIELTSGILVNEAFDFTDGDTTRFDRRFYRALKQ